MQLIAHATNPPSLLLHLARPNYRDIPRTQILSLFSFHALPELTAGEQRMLVGFDRVDAASRAPLLALLRYEKVMREAAVNEPTLSVARLSNRQLLRAKRHLAARPSDAEGALRRASAAALLAMPPAARETARLLLEAAVRAEGLNTAEVLRGSLASHGGEAQPSKPTAGAQEAAKRELKHLEEQAINLRVSQDYGMRNFELERAVTRGADSLAKKKDDAQKQRMKQVTQEAHEAAKGANGASSLELGGCLELQVAEGRLTIGDVSAPVRQGSKVELVPNPAFVPISGHVALLRELLIDWSLGQHLLLLGEQGVGKNKLVDKLLSLLSAEREYVQLHRDTTVASLTLRPVLKDGAILWEDSALVRAARLGRVLVVDEADKAPLEVVCVLKVSRAAVEKRRWGSGGREAAVGSGGWGAAVGSSGGEWRSAAPASVKIAPILIGSLTHAPNASPPPRHRLSWKTES